ncbi:MAG: hypothetical protein AB1567_08195 [bacterium]
MKRKFSITPVEGKKNEVEITFQKDFTLKVDKKDKVFVKFLMMLLHRGGGVAAYFAPLLDFTARSFHDIKGKVKKEGIKTLFDVKVKKEDVEKIKDADIGKIITLIVKNPKDTNKKIADNFNLASKTQISFKDVEKIRNKFGLKTS